MPSLIRTGDAADRAQPIALVDRREFLKLMAASIALAGTGCSHPPSETIVPSVEPSADAALGDPRYYASVFVLGGYAEGVLVRTDDGRPTKIEGNPRHPASLGATSVAAQASVLDVWSPERARVVTEFGAIRSWESFSDAIATARVRWRSAHGRGLRILTETVTSPTLAAQLDALRRSLPEARWHQFEPCHRDAMYEGTRLAFGRALEVRHHLDRANVVVTLDADVLCEGPASLRHARDWMRGRGDAVPANAKRLYAIHSSPTLSAIAADERLAVRSTLIPAVAQRLAQLIGVAALGPATGAAAGAAAAAAASVPGNDPLGAHGAAFVTACAAALAADRGESLVVAGERQPPIVHALAHAINDALGNAGNTVSYADPVCVDASSQAASLRALVADLMVGQVQTLLILGGNPAYGVPSDSGFAAALAHVPFTVHASEAANETSALCRWHLPLAHALEAWSDACAFDGTATIQQPAIAPLYAARSVHELLALVVDGVTRNGYDIVRETWRPRMGLQFELAWMRALRDGLVEGTASAAQAVKLRGGFEATMPATAVARAGDDGLVEVSAVPDAALWDGRFAHNAWLQELPRPLTKLTWDNAALVAPAMAKRLNLRDGDVVELATGSASLRMPILVVPGQPDGALSLAIGYGRTAAGAVGSRVGVDVHPLFSTESPWLAPAVALRKTGAAFPLAIAQREQRMQGRDLVRVRSIGDERAQAAPRRDAPPTAPSLYPLRPAATYAWGMAIDLAACTGCSACVVACQAENNIPVVGKDEVARGRAMHWLRIDRYDESAEDKVTDAGGEPESAAETAGSGRAPEPRTHFQPVPCMHCEHAPCEVVCPVEASVHDSEGLNVQVYNRCVGTRFCSNNCPYKVRRFNFLQYADLTTESLKGQRNPEVTVRMRGVMEKCSYCIQRIQLARHAAEREDRRIRDGEVVTACQAACPTQAIVFGDLNDPQSGVVRAKASPRNYALLAELNTRPRTTYLAKTVNPDPRLAPPGGKAEGAQ